VGPLVVVVPRLQHGAERHNAEMTASPEAATVHQKPADGDACPPKCFTVPSVFKQYKTTEGIGNKKPCQKKTFCHVVSKNRPLLLLLLLLFIIYKCAAVIW
jgi:hypothetical protein